MSISINTFNGEKEEGGGEKNTYLAVVGIAAWIYNVLHQWKCQSILFI